ncbi:MAG: fatty acid--CoA ligase family protein [Actinomycetota bacterium]|nr:fatty acid--CoA ligase family protein [Actinomycetota bacterium]
MIGAASDLSRRVTTVLGLDPTADALEFDGRWYTWGQVQALATVAGDQVAEPGTPVGIILRNRPAHVAAMLGVLEAGGCVVTINPHRGVDRTRDDIAQLGLGVIVGTPDDLAELVVDPARTTVAVTTLDAPATVTVDPDRDATAEPEPEVAVRMLTSGTTGPPKRVALTYDLLARVLLDAKHYEKDKGADVRLRSGVVIVNSPLVHLGGLFRILQCVGDGRAFCLLERFTVEGWHDAVRRHRPKTASLVPAALRMVLEADLPRDDLSSIRSVISGTAPLAPEDADAFLERYGIPVLPNYAATEFGGAVAGWNLADHAEWWSTKRGSVGRAHAGTELRVVDEANGSVLSTGAEGLLEVKAGQLGSREWVRTTDLAVIDGDGFLWIRGRADQAIIRGGFKVLPEVVKAALERHTEVRGASVIGRADARLGSVPVALVEPRPGTAITEADVLDHASRQLAPYEVPAEVRFVDRLPRTDSGKVDLVAVHELLAVVAGGR